MALRAMPSPFGSRSGTPSCTDRAAAAHGRKEQVSSLPAQHLAGGGSVRPCEKKAPAAAGAFPLGGRDLRKLYIGFGWRMAKAAPCGSVITEKCPVPGMLVGGTRSWAPNALALAAVASQSFVPK